MKKKLTLRDYQREASDAAVQFFNDDGKENAIIVLPTGSGKSIVISDIADRLNDNVLVFQPSKEILEQNYAKMCLYTDDCGMYSASVGKKDIKKITFATIGSIKNKIDEFKHFHYILIDECHGVSGESGMYLKFLSMLDCKVLGFTATPYRLYSERYFDTKVKEMRTRNSQLVMLTNDENKFFSKIIYKVQIYELLAKGYLANVRYFDCKPQGWNENRLFKNTSGSEYSEKSVQWMMEETDHLRHTASICRRLLQPKNGIPRNGILVFVQFTEDAEELCSMVADSAFVTGKTTAKNRERILQEFRNGEIKVLVNCGCFTTGLDIPSLDTIVMARPTLSLSLYYQIVGRCIRPYEGKDAWVIDTVGNVKRFGEVSELRVETSKATGTEEVFGWAWDYQLRRNTWKQLTGQIMN